MALSILINPNSKYDYFEIIARIKDARITLTFKELETALKKVVEKDFEMVVEKDFEMVFQK